MSEVKFVLKSILLPFKSEKLLLFLILLGMMISNVLFLVFGNFYFQDTQNLKEKEYQVNRVTFTFDSSSQFDEVYNNLSCNNDILQVVLQCVRQGDLGLIKIQAADPQVEYKIEQIKFGKQKNNKDIGWFMGSESFNLNLRNQNKPELRMNSSLTLDENNLSCIGIIMTEDFDISISIQDFLNITEATSFSITYIFNSKIGIDEIESINKEISDKYMPTAVIMPRETVRFSFFELIQILGINLILILITIINYFFLYMFFIKKRFYMYSIFKLLGMSKNKLFLFLFIEMLIWFLVSFLLAIPIYIFTFQIVLVTQITIEALCIQLLFSFIILFIMNLALFVASAYKTVRKNAVSLYTESVVE